jgi:putative intracellular protease/amidase
MNFPLPRLSRVFMQFTFLLLAAVLGAEPARILILATNVPALANGKTSGTYLVEIAVPFSVFKEAGFEVDIATPRGGPTAIYHVGRKSERLAAAEADPEFKARTAVSLRPDEIQPGRYAAVYYPGGHGQVFDLAGTAELHRAAEEIHGAGGWVGTAGHGAAMLVKLTAKDGRPFAAGKKLTCFPTWGELRFMDISEFGKLLPFNMETELRAQGADLHVPKESDTRDSAVVIDEANRLITGAWAANAEAVARQLVARLRPAAAAK